MRGNGKGLLIGVVCAAATLPVRPAAGADWSNAPAVGGSDALASDNHSVGLEPRAAALDVSSASLDSVRVEGAFLPAPGVLVLLAIALIIAGPWHRRRSPGPAEALSGPAD
jgi:hypothetical protein